MGVQEGTAAVAKWKMIHAELLLSFDPETFDTIYSWLRMELPKHIPAGANVENAGVNQLFAYLTMGFKDLVKTGVIAPVRPFSTAGQKLWDAYQLSEVSA